MEGERAEGCAWLELHQRAVETVAQAHMAGHHMPDMSMHFNSMTRQSERGISVGGSTAAGRGGGPRGDCRAGRANSQGLSGLDVCVVLLQHVSHYDDHDGQAMRRIHACRWRRRCRRWRLR